MNARQGVDDKAKIYHNTSILFTITVYIIMIVTDLMQISCIN